ncbi:DUF1672 family protein [Peribacillus frigoritolerans]|uniref:DUF1672 family protein n=1 Tax=Peribacillus frigoritolerans TaxID=450367 RepID=UPI00105A7371|nr:DUF1672 family protein [Peribacillus frigoritolerans]TDL74983.1 DUF1672 family protein [Peribacillus frigoritolerans]
MNYKKKLIISSMGLSLMLGGCSDMNNAGTEKEIEKQTAAQQEKQMEDVYVSVQDYKGEGYELDNGKKTDKIAESNREEIDEAVKAFFQDTYKTEVKVHNVVGAADGATVFVESVGEPHFYTYAIVPIEGDKVLSDKVWSQEGQVEDAIKTGIFAMIFDQEFSALDQYVEDVVKENPVVGITQEALETVRAGGYSTPYYYVNTLDPAFDKLYNAYLKNPDLSKEEWKQTFTKNDYPSKGVIITLYLYMKEEGAKPDQKVFDKVVKDLEEMDGFPRGSYSVYLNDNLIDKTNGIGTKDNTLERSNPDYIVKE